MLFMHVLMIAVYRFKSERNRRVRDIVKIIGITISPKSKYKNVPNYKINSARKTIN